jgi:membrane-associated protein
MSLVDVILHVDKYLGGIIQEYGVLTYAILFAIVFLETGLVITPFLPGDSLLFAAGAFASLGSLNVWLVAVLLSVAAIVGDTVNYALGKYLGPKVFSGRIKWLFHPEYLERTHKFYEKNGPKTIVLARFIPIIRTFAPFVAGIGRMSYAKFLFYNVFGGILWVALFTFGGYFFGGLDVVQQNFSLIILAIIVISLLPLAYEVWQHWRHGREH